jgi:predicted Zn-dependent peptidase
MVKPNSDPREVRMEDSAKQDPAARDNPSTVRNPYQITTLENGIRIATLEMPYMKSVSIGLWIGVGTRHEPESLNGISHFIEHLLFRGTENRTVRQINEEIEGLGGIINAFTTEDHTCFYAKAPARHLPILADVLCDMLNHSIFSEHDVEQERKVIQEEILMYKDQPAQLTNDLLTEVMWPNHALGRPITGSRESVQKIHRNILLEYLSRYYNGQNIVITVAGNGSHEKVVDLFHKHLSEVHSGTRALCEPWNEPNRQHRLAIEYQETEQLHLALGYYAVNRTDPRRYALKLLSVITGENMSSRLFQQLREQHAYCYSVHSGTLVLEDSGLFSIHTNTTIHKLLSVLKVIQTELYQLKSLSPSETELRQAKEYLIGQNELGLENTMNQIMWMGESLLAYDRVIPPEEVQTAILNIGPKEITEIAQLCFDPKQSGLAMVGPANDPELIECCKEVFEIGA